MPRLTLLLAGTVLSTVSFAPPVFAQEQTVQSQAPNASNQQPAFQQQTRAPLPESPTAVQTEVVASACRSFGRSNFSPTVACW
jgi:hypothetical protein